MRRPGDHALTATSAPPRWRAELRDQLSLALPLCGSHVGWHLMGLVDTAVLGRYSDAAQAGAGIAGGLYFAVTVIGMGAVMGLDTLIPQALGAGEPHRARLLMRRGVRLAAWLGLPLSLLALASTLLLPALRVDAEVAGQARLFMIGRLPGIIPILMFTAMRSYLQAVGVTRPLVLVVVAGNVLNFIADLILIFGVDAIGLPPLGVVGSAIASTSVVFLGLAVAVAAVRRVPVPAAGPGQQESPADSRRILGLGVPVGLQLAAEVGVFALAGALAGRLGEQPGAAHQVALSLASLTFSVTLGFAAATAVRVGRAVGAGDRAAARRAGLTGLTTTWCYMGMSALLFITLPGPLAGLLNDKDAVRAAAIPLIQIAALFQLSDGTQAVAAGALRGAGDTRASMVGNLVGHYAIGLPISIWLAFGVGLGAPGLWWGLSAGLTAVGGVLTARFLWLSGREIRRA